MLNETWRDQYDRMMQSFELLTRIGDPTAVPQDVLPPREVVYRFCCDAFHLRDYITADLTDDPPSRKQLEQQLDTDVILPSEELSACRDVANGSKHLRLDGPSHLSSGKHAEVASHNVTIGVPPMRAYASMPVPTTLRMTQPDGSTEVIAPDVAQQVPATPPPPPSTDESFIVNTLDIEINGQRRDARDVGANAIAAWDVWLKPQGMI